MFALEHRVRVFVFQFVGKDVKYLLLRHKPKAEWPLGPVVGAVRIDERMQDAIVREVREETGIRRPHHIIDLSEPSKELFGDVGLIEWPFAYQAATPTHELLRVTPGPTIGEYTWLGFEDAFQSVETRRDRQALVRLRLDLEG
jgi:ADP-ribose pyrophosphatase YjhB (NUDIX family)